MTERWAPIDGFVGRYEVSDHGRIKSLDFSRSGSPGIMSTVIRRGYLSVMLGRKQRTVHSLVAAAFIGPKTESMVINHIDGCKTNNAIENLEYVSPSDNQKHAFRLGLQSNVGERHSQARLSEDNVRKIRTLAAAGTPQASLGAMFGITQSCISHIVRGKRWAHVQGESL